MPTKSLEERQAEMRERMARPRPAITTERVTIESPGEPSEHDDGSEPPVPPEIKGDTLNREDLYALVWSEPMVKVARRFGISDVGLAKACRRHKIPLPGRAYWACV